MATKKMSNEEVTNLVASAVAKALPAEFIHQAVVLAVSKYIGEFQIHDYMVREEVSAVIKQMISERARVLLRERYEKEIESQAAAAVAKMMAGR